MGEKSRQAQLVETHERHQWHLNKLELLLRAVDNDSLDLSDLAIVRESVEVYIENYLEPDCYHDEALYDCFDLTEFELQKNRTGTVSVEVTPKGDTSSSKE